MKGLPAAPQQTAGGFRFWGDKWKAPDGTQLELHQHRWLRAFAGELDAPIGHRFGVRLELVHKHQELDEADISQAASGKLTAWGAATLDGWSLYAQAWAWVLGDDTIVGRPGLQLPPRFEKFGVLKPRHGLQLLARYEHLHETLSSDTPSLGDPNLGTTNVNSLTLGATYWYTKRFRAMVNYVATNFEGDSKATSATWTTLDGGHWEHELLFRLGVAL